MKRLCAFFSTAALMLSGCSDVTTLDYADKKPKLDIREYLNGKLEAQGILFDMSGKQDLSFVVKMKGEWKGNEGTLTEDFVFSNGKKDQRVWTIVMQDDHRFTAKAHDVQGEAAGTQHGNAVNMKYVLNVKRSSGETIALSMDDWMYLLEDNVLINRTKMKKFGLTVGELVLTFKKV